MMHEFECEDCGVHVTRYSGPDSNICFECTLLRSISDPAEREKIAAALGMVLVEKKQ